jgi:hypothetical protein
MVKVPKMNELSATKLLKDVSEDVDLKLFLPELKEKRSINR